ncbi:hypothetical protein ACHAXS_003707 [Conticribra weissflogii]
MSFEPTGLPEEGIENEGTFAADSNLSSLDGSNYENKNIDNLQREPVDDGNDNNSNQDIHPFDDNDEDKLDMASIISGAVEGDDDDDDDDDGNDDDDEDARVRAGEEGATAFFEKNLGEHFDAAEEVNQPATAASTSGSKHVNVECLRGPPLAPSRDGLKAPPETKPDEVDVGEDNDKQLSVFLRIRPPAGANGKKGDKGSLNTIEVIPDKITEQGLPTTIRTYPPTNSNAAKSVRKRFHGSSGYDSSNDDGMCDGEVDHAEDGGVKEYSYSGVFGPNATQKEVYDNVAAPLVDGLFPKGNHDDNLGESALLFTLGVTNVGKTHTVMGTGFEKHAENKNAKTGDIEPQNEWGIIPRSLHDILSRVKSMNAANPSGPQLQLYMSYLEIYNEQIYDLLPDKSNENIPKHFNIGPPALKLRERRHGRIFVEGLARQPVNSVQAKNNRHTASNNINTNSSRSHSICQFEIARSAFFFNQHGVQSDSGIDSECESICSRSISGTKHSLRCKSTIFWIVDLAGSERSKKTGFIHHHHHEKEAASINASLMNLMRCLREMLKHQPKKGGVTSKGGVAIPFRESKLTHMFKNHLTGPTASKTCLIVNVNPAAEDFDETRHVLSHAITARKVEISVVDHNRKRGFLAKGCNSVELTTESAPTNTKRIKLSSIERGPSLELERLCEENFTLKNNNDQLQHQLEELQGRNAELLERVNECEGEINRIREDFTNQIALLQRNNAKLLERVNECEDEPTRMLEEQEKLAATAPSNQNLFPSSDFENSSETIVASQQQPTTNSSVSTSQQQERESSVLETTDAPSQAGNAPEMIAASQQQPMPNDSLEEKTGVEENENVDEILSNQGEQDKENAK